ncbi:MAG TPA: tRNA pseudouridine(55) synthase TruB [Acidimicrobiaceae bacterium]|nr:tRNA pseudouridine(55) synthase TruB [Acidimicrobiaceae bacterium]HAX04606.1 tRNA pseudouridine(55) synthase TruB [Acidimicrobiaceae bacterium]|tara:strand:+ start:957 stop:1820 length:864 start_codon:yes stop_codon:yes gene_type:complete
MGRKPATVHGMVLIDKPAGITSHDVVAQLRKRFGERRIGHAGTLDPDATGLLVIGVGKATRLLRFATASFKTYEVEIVLGIETDTLDSSGQVVAEHRMSVGPAEVLEAASALTGKIEQIPPMVSARRVGGRRLHELAREGIEVDREARVVQIRKFDIRPTDDPLIWRAVVDCSAGTYIRTLGADLGIALQGGAHIRNLRRTRSGVFDLQESDTVDKATLQPVLELVRGLDRVVLTDEEMPLVRNGGRLVNERTEGAGPWALTDSSSNLIAVHEKIDDQVVVGVVLPD